MGAMAALLNTFGVVLLAHAYVLSPALSLPKSTSANLTPKQRLQRIRTLPPPDFLPPNQAFSHTPAIPGPANQPAHRRHPRNAALRLPPLHRHRAQQSRAEAHPMERLGGESRA